MVMSNCISLDECDDFLIIFKKSPRKHGPDYICIGKDGDLYMFVIKGLSSTHEIRQKYFGYREQYKDYSYHDLNEMFMEGNKKNHWYRDTDADLKTAHQRHFRLKRSSVSDDEHFNRSQHLVFLLNGLNHSMLSELWVYKQRGLHIDAIVYWLHMINGKHILDIKRYSPEQGHFEYESSVFLFNTINDQLTEKMMKAKGAISYSSMKLKYFNKGETVFLYKSGVGVIAFGIASGIVETIDGPSRGKKMYFTRLQKFKKLSKPVTIERIGAIANLDFSSDYDISMIHDEVLEPLIQEIERYHL